MGLLSFDLEVANPATLWTDYTRRGMLVKSFLQLFLNTRVWPIT
jgi:hypothetical protein